MSVLPFLIIETGHPVPEMKRYGRFQHWIRVAAGLAEQETVAIDVANGDALPDPADFAGIIVSGSAAFVTDRADWSERSAEWLRHAAHQACRCWASATDTSCSRTRWAARSTTTRPGANPAPSRWNCIRRPSRILYLQAFRRSSRPMPPTCRRSCALPKAPSCWRTRAGPLPCLPLGPGHLGRPVPSRIRHSPHARLRTGACRLHRPPWALRPHGRPRGHRRPYRPQVAAPFRASRTRPANSERSSRRAHVKAVIIA